MSTMEDRAEEIRYDAAYQHALKRSKVLTDCEQFARYAVEEQTIVSIPHAWVMFRGQEGKEREPDNG